MVVSFKASAARLSHEDANAGTADRHARTNIAHFIIGSVAEHVVREAPCLVLTLTSAAKERFLKP